MIVVCRPVGIDGPIGVPNLGTFAPGAHEVTEEVAAVLLSTPHFTVEVAPRRPKRTGDDSP